MAEEAGKGLSQCCLIFAELAFYCVVGGGIVLRCDVFVDTIFRIEITTRSRELLLEEEPERFELQAFDEEGKYIVT